MPRPVDGDEGGRMEIKIYLHLQSISPALWAGLINLQFPMVLPQGCLFCHSALDVESSSFPFSRGQHRDSCCSLPRTWYRAGM